MAKKNEWTKRIDKIVGDLSDLRLDAQDIGDKYNEPLLLTASRNIIAAQNDLTLARAALIKVKS